MTITVADIRAISNLLLKRLEERGYSSIVVSADYYWTIPKEEKYDRQDSPKNLDIGQLSEDWERLEKMLRGETEPVVYALVWLAEILRYVGEEIGD